MVIEKKITVDEVLAGYDEVSKLYPYVLSMLLWRAWEAAVYRHYTLLEPVLDIGCGDGWFFQHVWPEIKDVVGVDSDVKRIRVAEQSGRYRETHIASAHQILLPSNSFNSAFANCALEHMEELPQVLRSIGRCLRPESPFLFSVVTDKFVEWSLLPLLLEKTGASKSAKIFQSEFENYHHLVSPLTPGKWVECVQENGFEVVDYWPIVPELTSRFFLIIDQLWHLPTNKGEFGELIHKYLHDSTTAFPQQFRNIFEATLKMENDFSVCSGAVFFARKTK